MGRAILLDAAVVTDLSASRSDASFDQFYRREYPLVVRLAASLVGRFDVAEELAQEAFISAHSHWQRIEGYDSPEAWVRRVVMNRAVSSLRRRATEARLLVRLGSERPRLSGLTEPAEELWAEVRRLPRRQAQVLALMYVEDRSVAEVAEILACDQDTVRTHLRRGRLTLSLRLAEHEEER